jgi:6-phosphogluconolactonase
MRCEIYDDRLLAAKAAASRMASEARAAIEARGQFTLALSGGQTPWIMMRELAKEEIPWSSVHVFQVDERVAPAWHDDRNLMHLQETLLEHVPIPPHQVHAMAADASDLETAAASYARELRNIAGSPAILDLVLLGLGADGHTASLVPGDPVLEMNHTDVALTGMYHGRYRMTLTYAAINRARKILWLITGSEKAGMYRRLCERDMTIPAGRVCPKNAIAIADRQVAGDPGIEIRQGA